MTDAPFSVESPGFRSWGEWILAHRGLALAALLLVTGLFAWLAATRLTVDNSTEYFASGFGDSADVLEQFREDFGRDDPYYVLVQGDVFTLDFLRRLRALHEALEDFDLDLGPDAGAVAVEGFEEVGDAEGWGEEAGGLLVEDVTSLVDFRQTVNDDGVIRVVGFLDDPPRAGDLPALKARALADRAMVGNILGRDGRRTVLAVRTRPLGEEDSDRVAVALADLVAAHDAEGFRAQVTGSPTMNQTFNAMVLDDLDRLVGIALLVMLGVLVALFRRPIAVVPPLLVVVFASVWTLGAMAATGTPLTLLTNVLPAFLLCVGLGDAIHLVTVWRDGRRTGIPNREAVLRAVASTGVPITFTSLTTAAGLASFAFASTRATREVGLAGAFGVLAAWAITLVLMPATLSFWNRGVGPARDRPRDRLDAAIDALVGASATPRGRTAVLVVSAAVGLAALAGIAQLQIRHDPLAILGERNPVTRGIRAMDAHVGGTAVAYLVIDPTGARGARDLDLLRGMEGLEAHLLSYRQPGTGEAVVTHVSSLLEVLRETRRALHRGDPATYALPATQRGVDDALFVFENAGSSELGRLVTLDAGRTQMTVRLKWMDARAYAPFSAHVDEGVARWLGDRARVRPTGTVYHVLTVTDAMVGDLARSFGTALVAITLMMVVLLRRVRLGLLALVPNLVPVAVVLGFMGWTGIPMDLNNLLIASIVLGIAVDDTIHFMHQFRVAFRATGSVESAIAHAVDHAGRAMVQTSLVLVLGFSVYLAAHMHSLQQFGLLSALACAVALSADLVLAPALLRRWHDGPPPAYPA